MAENICRDEQASQHNIQQVKETSRKYEQLSNSIKEIKTKEELSAIIEQLKQNGLYDDSHPYFVKDSPFYLSSTEEDYLEVLGGEPVNEEGLSLYEIN